MTDQNPAAEAAALAAKPAPSPPPMPSGSILGDAAKPAFTAKPTPLVTNLNAVAAAEIAIQTAITQISQAGNVTGDLALATAACKQALKWLADATAAANTAAAKA